MPFYIELKYRFAVIALDALLYPLLLFQVHDMHEFIADGVAIDALEGVNDLP